MTAMAAASMARNRATFNMVQGRMQVLYLVLYLKELQGFIIEIKCEVADTKM